MNLIKSTMQISYIIIAASYLLIEKYILKDYYEQSKYLLAYNVISILDLVLSLIVMFKFDGNLQIYAQCIVLFIPILLVISAFIERNKIKKNQI